MDYRISPKPHELHSTIQSNKDNKLKKFEILKNFGRFWKTLGILGDIEKKGTLLSAEEREFQKYS